MGRAGPGVLLMHADLLPQAFSERLLGTRPLGDGRRDQGRASVVGWSQKR